MAADIQRMEEVLRRLRQAATEAGVADRFSAQGSGGSGRGTLFTELYTAGEGQWDWQRFYHHFGFSRRYGSRAAVSISNTEPGPQWVRLSSESRLTWGRHLPSLLRALEGLPVSVSLDNVWRWDRQNPRGNGQPTFVPIYQVFVSLRHAPAIPFEPEAVVQQLQARHCMVPHAIADKHLFDWQEDVLGRLLFSGYGWTPTGFRAAFFKKGDMVEACDRLFKDLSLTVEKQGKARHWVVTVNLDSSPKKALIELAESLVSPEFS